MSIEPSVTQPATAETPRRLVRLREEHLDLAAWHFYRYLFGDAAIPWDQLTSTQRQKVRYALKIGSYSLKRSEFVQTEAQS